MSAAEQLARQLADAEFNRLLVELRMAGRSYERAVKLAAVVESFMSDLEGMSGLLAVEDAAAQLSAALSNCYARPAQLAIYGQHYRDALEEMDDDVQCLMDRDMGG